MNREQRPLGQCRHTVIPYDAYVAIGQSQIVLLSLKQSVICFDHQCRRSGGLVRGGDVLLMAIFWKNLLLALVTGMTVVTKGRETLAERLNGRVLCSLVIAVIAVILAGIFNDRRLVGILRAAWVDPDPHPKAQAGGATLLIVEFFQPASESGLR